MNCRLTEFTAMLQKAVAYRMRGRKPAKARTENAILRTEWHKQYLTSPFIYACVDLKVRKILLGTDCGTQNHMLVWVGADL